MKKAEKILLLQSLMEDIRMSWDVGKKKRFKDKRVWKCVELVSELFTYEKRTGVNWFKFYESLGVYLVGHHEGRYLRMPYSNGGYQDLHRLHRLARYNFDKRSWHFNQAYNELMRCPASPF